MFELSRYFSFSPVLQNEPNDIFVNDAVIFISSANANGVYLWIYSYVFAYLDHEYEIFIFSVVD